MEEGDGHTSSHTWIRSCWQFKDVSWGGGSVFFKDVGSGRSTTLHWKATLLWEYRKYKLGLVGFTNKKEAQSLVGKESSRDLGGIEGGGRLWSKYIACVSDILKNKNIFSSSLRILYNVLFSYISPCLSPPTLCPHVPLSLISAAHMLMGVAHPLDYGQSSRTEIIQKTDCAFPSSH